MRTIGDPSSNKLRRAIAVNSKSDTAQKRSNHTATDMTDSEMGTVLAICTALRDDEKSHKRQYNELQGGHIPDSRHLLSGHR